MNKNIVECKACNGQVSKKAKTCPHCGENKPAKKRKEFKEFSEQSKPAQVLQMMGVILIATFVVAITNAPDKPKRKLTDNELKAGITRAYCHELVMDSLKTKDGASIPTTRNYPQSLDSAGFVWGYKDTVIAKNNIGTMTEKPFECHVSFALGKEYVKYLKIGRYVLVGGK